MDQMLNQAAFSSLQGCAAIHSPCEACGSIRLLPSASHVLCCAVSSFQLCWSLLSFCLLARCLPPAAPGAPSGLQSSGFRYLFASCPCFSRLPSIYLPPSPAHLWLCQGLHSPSRCLTQKQ